MKKDNGLWFIMLIILGIFLLTCCQDKEEHKEYEPPHVKDKSSYWYDSPTERRRKADETLNKYYTRDENGNLKRREGTIVNGKPWKEE